MTTDEMILQEILSLVSDSNVPIHGQNYVLKKLLVKTIIVFPSIHLRKSIHLLEFIYY